LSERFDESEAFDEFMDELPLRLREKILKRIGGEEQEEEQGIDWETAKVDFESPIVEPAPIPIYDTPEQIRAWVDPWFAVLRLPRRQKARALKAERKRRVREAKRQSRT
jgi:hypothetical protein